METICLQQKHQNWSTINLRSYLQQTKHILPNISFLFQLFRVELGVREREKTKMCAEKFDYSVNLCELRETNRTNDCTKQYCDS